MFPPYLSRAITPLLMGVAILAGCAVQRPAEVNRQDTVKVVTQPSAGPWLDQLEVVEAMDTNEVMEQLERINKTDGANQLYYFGILNQRLQDYGAWTVARDAFQKLQQDEALPEQQRQLAALLRQYNQNRINAYQRYNTLVIEQAKLREGLSRAEEEKRQLELKIQALTELETAISTRQEE